jgi:hypothetical protein
MSRTFYLNINVPRLKTFGYVILGALTYVECNIYITTKAMEIYNKKHAIQNNNDMAKIKQEYEKNMDNIHKRHETDINELKEKIRLLQTKQI